MAPLYLKNSLINFEHECDLLGITLSSNITTVVVDHRVLYI